MRPATPFFRTGLYCFQYKLKLYSPVQLKSDLAMSEPCILLQSTCTTTYQVTTLVKQSI